MTWTLHSPFLAGDGSQTAAWQWSPKLLMFLNRNQASSSGLGLRQLESEQAGCTEQELEQKVLQKFWKVFT